MVLLLSNLAYLNPFSKKTGYIGWLNKSNLGDEVLFQAFKVLFPSILFLPFKTSKKIDQFEKLTGSRIFANVFLGGGTLINSAYYDDFRSAQEKGIKTIVFGAGVKSPDFWQKYEQSQEGLNNWIELLQRCSFVGVRGPLSQELLKNAGFSKSQIVGDPVFSLADKMHQQSPGKKIIGINVGFTHGKMWGEHADFLKKMVKLINHLVKDGWTVKLLSVYEKDDEVINQLLKSIQKPLSHFSIYDNIQEARKFFSGCDIFVGEKLHSVALGICSGVPSVMLEYQPKCRDFMMSMDLERYNYRTDQFDDYALYNLIEKMYENRLSLREKILKKVEYYRNLQTEKSGDVIRLLKGVE